MKRRRHTPEQIVWKLAIAEHLRVPYKKRNKPLRGPVTSTRSVGVTPKVVALSNVTSRMGSGTRTAHRRSATWTALSGRARRGSRAARPRAQVEAHRGYMDSGVHPLAEGRTDREEFRQRSLSRC